MTARTHTGLPAGLAWLLRELRRGSRLLVRQPAAVFGLFGIVVLWFGVLHGLSSERRELIEDAFGDTAKFARAFEEQALGSIRAIDQTLHYVRASYTRDPAHFDISFWAEQSQFHDDPVFQIGIIDKDGYLTATNLGPVMSPLDLGDREFFRSHARDATDTLLISKPMVGRVSGKLSLQFTRPVIAADGAFGGVVVASLDPYSLSRFFDSTKLGDEGAVALVGTDGIIRARAPNVERSIGQSLIDTPLLRAAEQSPAGSLLAVGRVDGVGRIYSYRKVSGYPLVVVVGESEREVLAIYIHDRLTYLLVASLVSVLIVIVMLFMLRHQGRLEHAREALHASEARYAEKSQLLETTLGNMTQGIMLIDADLTLQVVNRRAAELLNLPETLLNSRPHLADVLRIAWQRGDFGPCTGTFEGWFPRFLEEHAAPMHVREHHQSDGTVVEVCSNQLPDGRVVRTFSDITQRTRSEDELRAARDAAWHAAQAKSEFLAMMSHEIRSPMSGLLGIIELLRGTRLDADQTQMVGLVHGAAASLLRILNDVLDFAKIEAGAVELALEPVDLRVLVADLVGAMSPNAVAKATTLTGEVAADVPRHVSTDPVRLRQILTNLLGNAIKFTTDGSVVLAIRTAPLANGTPGLSIAVSDTGIGIPSDIIECLFEPFSQADASTTKQFGGTGLGLTISRRLARLLGGDIVASSIVGQGSVFTVVIPLVTARSPAAEADGGVPGRNATLAPMRILVAEDQLTNRWLIQRQLERLGATVTAVEDGRAALVAFGQENYDLIVTDCHMPGIDGIELVRLIRAAEAQLGVRNVPILGLTADVTATMQERCLGIGMNDVVAKPIDLHRLHAAITRITATGAVGDMDNAVRDAAEAFDPATYQELFADDAAAGREWLEAYLTAAADLAAGIAQAAAGADRSALRAGAHRLAGASLSAGAMVLGALARRLEAAAANASEHELQEYANEIAGALRAVQAAIAGFLAEPVPAT